MGLARPIAECRFLALVAGAAVQSGTAGQAAGLLQCDGEAPR
jgi:hypothetical protein